MITISLCMIVKDEEDVLSRCLKSVIDLVDEVIVVDTGSTDRTKEIALEYTEKVYDFAWIDDFAAARNYAFSKASGGYCMWLDADDVLLEADRQMFLQWKAEMTEATDVVMMKYNTGFDEKGRVTFSYYRERVIKNHAGMQWVGAVHEVIPPAGVILYSDCAVTHQKIHPSDPDRNLRILEKELAKGKQLDPRQQFYYGRELYDHKRYKEAVQVLGAFLKEDAGWLENKIDACRYCAYCHYALDQDAKALQSYLYSFHFDLPRAEVCCDIGRHFFDRERYPLAAYWYERALSCQREDTRGGFISPDAYGFVPCIQLCVCFWKMGDEQKAVEYNERAARYKPDAEAVIQNSAFFSAYFQE